MIDRLNNLTMGTKTILLTAFILGFAAINILIFTGIYFAFSNSKDIPYTYQQNLQIFQKQYAKQQQNFQNFTFYSKYNSIIFNNDQVKEGYIEGIKSYANLTQKQFFNVYDIVKKIAIQKNFGEIAKLAYNYSDWSRKDTIIRDQNGYNSSYIFAALTSIQYQINGGNKTDQSNQWITLSAQEIIDCCPECVSSQKPQAVFEYIRKNGVTTEKQYPYENSRFDTQPKKCRREEKSGRKYFIKGYRSIKNCQALEKQIALAPVVVGVDGRNFPQYQYSIFSQCQRKTTHYTTLVGISYDHWKLQNSWGIKWGERGFIRIGPGDTCGVCLRGFAPILKTQ